MSDEDDEQDRDSPDYHKADPHYHPIEFVWKFDKRFRKWRMKFTKPNGINHPDKCVFVYCAVENKLI
ncbi:hypothetical protein Hanom_Chr14g01265411 [Helianthus anomalus]